MKNEQMKELKNEERKELYRAFTLKLETRATQDTKKEVET